MNPRLASVWSLLGVGLALFGCGPGGGGGSPDGALDAPPEVDAPEVDAPTDAPTDAGDATDAGCGAGSSPGAGLRMIAKASPAGVLGTDVALVLDDLDDPLVAYLHRDPDGDTRPDDSRLYFTRWDRCSGDFRAPTVVDVVGAVDSNQPTRAVGIARDRSTGAIGLGYARVDAASSAIEVWLAVSKDDGKSWVKSKVSQASSAVERARNPAIAMAGGRVFVAYSQEWQRCGSGAPGVCDGAYYHEGTPTALVRTLLPVVPGMAANWVTAPIGLALDASNAPALAYFLLPADAASNANRALAFFRPGTSSATKITDSAGVANDTASVSLAFDGSKPRVAAHFVRDTSGTHDLTFVASADGITWSAPVAVPRDGADVTAWYQSLTVDPSGNVAIASYWQGGATGGTCGGPKIARTSDLATFSVCGADADRASGTRGLYVSAATTKAGKLVLAFQVVGTSGTQPPGVVLYREP